MQRFPNLVLFLAICCFALAPASTMACGMPLNARIASEKALIVFDGQTVALTTSVGLEPTDANAAVVFPVPAPAEVDQPAGGEQLFSYLEGVTAPLLRVEQRYHWGFEPDGAMTGGAPPGGVAVLGRETLGGYDVARLAADDPQALGRWLAENGFDTPAGAEDILAAYVAEGWSFVAVRLAPDAPGGSLAPLRMRYTDNEVVYPMRLGALSEEPVGVDLYVVANYRTAIDGLETAFAGTVSSLEAQPGPEIGALLSGAPYMTKLISRGINPASITSDALARQADNDEPYREVITRYDDIWIFSVFGPLIAMVIAAIMLSVGVFYGALALRRRMQEIESKEP
jgi:hypothetical protein